MIPPQPVPFGPVGSPARTPVAPSAQANLADILERVLDKGIVIAGDIRVNLLDIELLTIKIRLIVASVDRAREMGIDWWEHDPSLSSGPQQVTVTSPVSSPVVAPATTQFVAPATTQFAAPATTQFATPVTTQFASPVISGPIVAGPDE